MKLTPEVKAMLTPEEVEILAQAEEIKKRQRRAKDKKAITRAYDWAVKLGSTVDNEKEDFLNMDGSLSVDKSFEGLGYYAIDFVERKPGVAKKMWKNLDALERMNESAFLHAAGQYKPSISRSSSASLAQQFYDYKSEYDDEAAEFISLYLTNVAWEVWAENNGLPTHF